MAIEAGKIVWHKQSGQKMVVAHDVPHLQDESQNYWKCSWQDNEGMFHERDFPESLITEENPYPPPSPRESTRLKIPF